MARHVCWVTGRAAPELAAMTSFLLDSRLSGPATVLPLELLLPCGFRCSASFHSRWSPRSRGCLRHMQALSDLKRSSIFGRQTISCIGVQLPSPCTSMTTTFCFALHPGLEVHACTPV